MKDLRLIVILLLGLIGLSLAQACWAEEKKKERLFKLEDVVVTAENISGFFYCSVSI